MWILMYASVVLMGIEAVGHFQVAWWNGNYIRDSEEVVHGYSYGEFFLERKLKQSHALCCLTNKKAL